MFMETFGMYSSHILTTNSICPLEAGAQALIIQGEWGQHIYVELNVKEELGGEKENQGGNVLQHK